MFYKILTTPKGSVVNFHGITEIKAKIPQDENISAIVSSYTSEGEYYKNPVPVHKVEVFIPITASGANLVRSLEQWLISSTESNNKFFGGTLISNNLTDPLDIAKRVQIAIIKSSRDINIAKIDPELSTAEMSNSITNIKNIYRDLRDQILVATDISIVQSIIWPE